MPLYAISLRERGTLSLEIYEKQDDTYKATHIYPYKVINATYFSNRVDISQFSQIAFTHIKLIIKLSGPNIVSNYCN